MRHLGRRIALILIMALCIPTVLHASGKAWIQSYAAGIRLARQLRQPVLLDFSAWWCGSCLRMEQEVYSMPRFIEAAKNLVLIRVDVDCDPGTASVYNIRQVPTVIFIDPWGNVLARRDRRARLGDVLQMIKALPETIERVVTDLDHLSGDDPNPASLPRVKSSYR